MSTVKRSDVYNYTGWSKENVDYAENVMVEKYINARVLQYSYEIHNTFFPNVSVRNLCVILEKIN